MKNLSDIARELNVSTSTVSYVYHDKWRAKGISQKLAERVLAKLKEESVLPSMLGQQLRSGETKTVGLLLPNLAQPYFLQLLSGVEEELGRSNYMLLLGNSPRRDPALQTAFLEAMAQRNVDRVLLSPLPAEGLHDQIDRIRARKIPVIFVNNYLPDYDVPYVVSDNRWGAKQLVSHVLASKRRRILFIGSTPRVAIFADRLAGYTDALAEAGVKYSDKLVLWREQLQEKFLTTVHERLKSSNRPDAIFFDSLIPSEDVVTMIHESFGLKHPDDILFCGFDQPLGLLLKTAFRETILAPIPSARQDAQRMGACAAELALTGTVEGEKKTSALIRPFLSWDSSKTAVISEPQLWQMVL